MINKKRVIFIIIGLVNLAIIIFLVIAQPSILHVHPDSCLAIFGCTPDEFFDKEFEFYDTVGDLRKQSFVSRRGYLNIFLTRWDMEEWLQTDWLISFNELKDHPYLEVSPDLSTVTLYFSPELDEALNSPEKRAEIDLLLELLVTKIGMINDFNNQKTEIEYIVWDTTTHEVIYYDVVK